MKPAPFEYRSPDSLGAALALMEEHGDDAKLLAGGQSLIPVMNFRLAQPAMLVDLNRLGDLDFIREDGEGGLKIGAMTRQHRLETDPLVALHAPLLHETIPFIAHPQIRNRGTVGGSLAHSDPAAELPALALALRGRLRLQKTGGDRWVDAQDFFVALFTTALEPEEMVTELALPPLPPGTGGSFMEIARRHGDYAQVGLAATVTLDANGICREARLVYLSVGDVPMEATEAAASLIGQVPSEKAIAAAADKATSEEIEPTGDIHASEAFKRHLARVLTVRALSRAAERSRGQIRDGA